MYLEVKEVNGVKEVKRRFLSFGVSSLTSKATKELTSITSLTSPK